jgi:type VI secretion system protein ImpA
MSAEVATASTAPTTGAPLPSTPEVVDMAALLAPIDGENPSGENLQYVGIHDEIREARRAEDTLEQGDWKREPKVSDWHAVESIAVDALSTRTKDLQICAWMTEALVKMHGFTGLRDGLRTMRGLHENFWDTLYPEIDEGDLEARTNSLAWIDKNLPIPIKEVVITNNPIGDNYSYLQWEESKQFDLPDNIDALSGEEFERADALRLRVLEEHRTTAQAWRKTVAATRRAYYEQQFALITECRAECDALDRVMDERYGNDSPGLNSLKKAVDDVLSLVEKLVKQKRIEEPDPVETTASGTDANGDAGDGAGVGLVSAGGVAVPGGAVRSRQEALRRLDEIATFFRQTEPHSPISYLVQRAVKWGNMPLDAWLQEVIKEGAALETLRDTLGIKTSDAATDGGDGGYTDSNASSDSDGY